MRPIKLCLVLAAACISFEYADAQASDKTQRTIGVKTQNIKVAGDCDLCKKKIERTANSVAGVKSAEWNGHTKMLTIQYDVFKKEAVDHVQQKIAAVGYDTEKYSAGDAAYQQPPCWCQRLKKQS